MLDLKMYITKHRSLHVKYPTCDNWICRIEDNFWKHLRWDEGDARDA
jgi:hypothetical protein